MLDDQDFTRAKVARQFPLPQSLTQSDIRLLSWLVSRSYPRTESPGFRFSVISAYYLAQALYGWSESLWHQAREARRQLDQLQRRRLLYVTWFPSEQPCELDDRLWIIINSRAIKRTAGNLRKPGRRNKKKPGRRP